MNDPEEERLIELARMASIRSLHKNVNYTFDQQKVHVTTQFNNGQININGRKYINKCFAISIAHKMITYGFAETVKTQNGIIPLSLAIVFFMGFQYETKILDTDNTTHQLMITRLLKECPYLQLQIFIGRKQNDKWYTTPSPPCVFGKGDLVIKILNKGLHFELITTADQELLPSLMESRMIANDPIVQEQHNIMQQIEQRKQTLYDSFIAFNLATYQGMDEKTARMLAIQQEEERRIERQIERQKKADAEKARQLAIREVEQAAQISSDSFIARLLVDQN